MEGACVSADSEFNLTGQGEAVHLVGSVTSANFFSVMGVPVERGRHFEPGEDRPGKNNVVILSDSLWGTRFHGDSQVVGRVITLNGMDREVVGVMPPSFNFPSPRVQLWAPMRVDPSVMQDYFGGMYEPLIARIRPGATVAQAQGEVHAITAALDSSFPFPMPRNWNMDSRVIPLQEAVVGNVRRKLLVLLCSVAIVLLVACTHVASLLLARATTRRKEIALRASLGAGRFRIVRQLLTESILLAICGGALGLLVAFAALSVFRSVLPPNLPGLAEVSIDGHVSLLVAALTIATGLIFGIAPALSASQIDLALAIAVEVTLTVVLLVGSGLLARSLQALAEVNPSFRPDHVLTIRTPEPIVLLGSHQVHQPLWRVAAARSKSRRSGGCGGFEHGASRWDVSRDRSGRGRPSQIRRFPRSDVMDWRDHAPLSLAPARIPLLAGRGFTDADSATSAEVVLVTESTARRFWPGTSGIGRHVKGVSDKRWRTVVGVVADVHQYGLMNRVPDGISGAIYVPYAQAALENQQLPAAMYLVVRTAGDPARAAQQIRTLAVDQNPNVPVSEVQTLESMVSGSISDFRSTMGVLLSFALTALRLAAIGIYGLVSHSAAQRTYEIGVRMALGASKPGIIGMILTQNLRFVATGILAGSGAAMVFTRFLSSLLYGVAATDPATFAGVILFVFGVAGTTRSLFRRVPDTCRRRC